jgi:hypothetical protein
MEWYRAYHGMPYDPKLLVIARRTKQPMAHVVAVWLCALDSASKNDPRGTIRLDSEEVAVLQDIELEAVESILEALHDKGLIDKNHKLTAWDKRQHTTSTERMRKHRDSKKNDVTGGDVKKQTVTAGDAKKRKNRQNRADTEQSRTDSEHNKSKQIKKRKRTGESERTKLDIQILQQMLDIWNEEVQSKLTPNQKSILTPKRKELLAIRWDEDFQKDIRAWKYYCEIIGKSDFCLGKIEGKDWTIDLTWAISTSEHIAKVLEGGFSGGKHPSKPSECIVPEFVEAWDYILGRLQTKLGKNLIRNWFSNTRVLEINRDSITLECPRKFIKKWIEQNFLSDLNQFLAEQPHYPQKITSTKLITKEESS